MYGEYKECSKTLPALALSGSVQRIALTGCWLFNWSRNIFDSCSNSICIMTSVDKREPWLSMRRKHAIFDVLFIPSFHPTEHLQMPQVVSPHIHLSINRHSLSHVQGKHLSQGPPGTWIDVAQAQRCLVGCKVHKIRSASGSQWSP